MDGESLLKSVTANPDEDAAALVFADWLQENGATGLAVALRAAVTLRRNPTVYVVSSGSYSDYSVVGVYSSRENAQKLIDTDPKSSGYPNFNDIEEYQLDQSVSLIDSGLLPFAVVMLLDGNEARAKRDTPPYMPFDKVTTYGWFNGRKADGISVCVWARDEQHAIKIANEKRIAYLADPTRGKKP